MSRDLDAAREAVVAAEANAARWDAALGDARRAAEEIARDVPNSPEHLDGYAKQHADAEGRIAAAHRGLGAAHAAITTAREAEVRAEHADAQDAAKKARRALEQHERKRDGLLASLRDLEGVDYRPAGEDAARETAGPGEAFAYTRSRSAILSAAVADHEAAAAVLAYVLEHREIPMGAYQVAGIGAASQHISEYVTSAAREWVDALRAAGEPSAADAKQEAARAAEDARREAQEDTDRPTGGWRRRLSLAGPRSSGLLPR